MKNLFKKGALLLFVVMAVFAFVGCEDLIGGISGVGGASGTGATNTAVPQGLQGKFDLTGGKEFTLAANTVTVSGIDGDTNGLYNVTSVTAVGNVTTITAFRNPTLIITITKTGDTYSVEVTLDNNPKVPSTIVQFTPTTTGGENAGGENPSDAGKLSQSRIGKYQIENNQGSFILQANTFSIHGISLAYDGLYTIEKVTSSEYSGVTVSIDIEGKKNNVTNTIKLVNPDKSPSVTVGTGIVDDDGVYLQDYTFTAGTFEHNITVPTGVKTEFNGTILSISFNEGGDSIQQALGKISASQRSSTTDIQFVNEEGKKYVPEDDMSNLFKDFEKLETFIGLHLIDTSKVYDMSSMFSGCEKLGSTYSPPDLTSWNTQNVRNMSRMFEDCSELRNVTFGGDWNTINVKDMSYMFKGCSRMDTFTASGFNTQNVTTMYAMFMNNSIRDLDLSGFNTTNVTDMRKMFSRASLTKLNINGANWNTLKVTTVKIGNTTSSAAEGMFEDCNYLSKDQVILYNNGASLSEQVKIEINKLQ